MELEGWNRIPVGYMADFDVASAPWWLRLWFHTPFVDRFAYPVMVGRGFGQLTAQPGTTAGDRGPIHGGWKLRPDDFRPPGSVTRLE